MCKYRTHFPEVDLKTLAQDLLPLARTLALAVGVSLTACGGGGGTGDTSTAPTAAAGTDHVAPNPADQWTLVAAADVGMDPALLARATSAQPADSVHRLSSMLVLRHGKPVVEQYWNGYDKDTLHDLRSATKSITSLLMGVAIDQRLIGAVTDPLATYLAPVYPDAPAFRLQPTLQDLLTMRSGLDCDDWVASSPGNEDKMYRQTDWVKFYTALPAVAAPGAQTRYCTGNPVALGRVLALTGKKPVAQFAEEVLFGPLGIHAARWAMFDGGNQTDTGGHLRLRPRDMAKLGQLVLQKGSWNGKQLVSSAWIEESTRKHTHYASMSERNDYGYLWWRGSGTLNGQQYQIVFADGNGGQYIMILPELDIVAVFTGENYNSSKSQQAFNILSAYIVASVKN